MLRPYLVEMTITAVVMAESEVRAMAKTEASAFDICHDGDLSATDATAIDSLEYLARLDSDWDGDCLPYGGDGVTPLKALLPEETPSKDTLTADMFATPNE
jgi:hypothetical protein